MKKVFYFLVIISLNFSHLFADLSQVVDNRRDLRCLQLIPELVSPLAVDFAIPSNFVAMSPNSKPEPCDWIYWGPADVLTKYFENPDSLDQPLIRLKLSASVSQSEMYNLGFLKEDDIEVISSSKLNWGMYPVQAISAKAYDSRIHLAWVGLNSESNATLLFNLVQPKNKTTEQNLAFWRSFLEKTSQLPERLLYMALGLDLRQGHTIVTCNAAWDTAKIKAIAERRKHDNKLQVALIPISDNLKIQCLELEKGFKGGDWKFGNPLVKLFCQVTENVSETYTNHFQIVISILEKTVEDFSFSNDDAQIAWINEPCNSFES